MFCPLNYLSVMAKQLNRRLDGCFLSSQPNESVSVVMKVSVTSSDSFEFCNKSLIEKQEVLTEVFRFFEVKKSKSVMVFTDGSVHGAPVGCGACAAVLVPLVSCW